MDSDSGILKEISLYRLRNRDFCKEGRFVMKSKMPAMTLITIMVFVFSANIVLAAGKELKEVTCRWGWTFGMSYSPLVIAEKKGFFEKYGIKVKNFEGNSSGNAAKAVATGNDTFFFGDTPAFVQVAAAGAPIVIIGVLYQQSAQCIASRAEKPILKPKDLEGKTIALTSGDMMSQVLPAILEKNNVDKSKIKYVYVDAAAKAMMLEAGKVDGSGLSLSSQVPSMEAKGVKMAYLKFADWGANTLEYGAGTNRKVIQENPEVVSAFMKGLKDAVEWCLNPANDGEKYAILAKEFPSYDRKVLERQWELRKQMFYTPRTKGKPYSWTAEEDWQDLLTLLSKYSKFKGSLNPKDYYTNDFVAQ